MSAKKLKLKYLQCFMPSCCDYYVPDVCFPEVVDGAARGQSVVAVQSALDASEASVVA